ncbi:MAG: ParA family protein [Gammaproteobacteria bacterium]|nr:ParA family protein [Gammaproteobacteria bacterium]
MEPIALRTLVVNGKGGCGKTTIATNLAAAYARLGHRVVLIDHDAQASSAQWLEQRGAPLPPIHLVEAHQRTGMYTTRAFAQRMPAMRTASSSTRPRPSVIANSIPLLRGVDAIIVPLLPSSIDIRAGARFIAQLLTHRLYRARPIPVAVVANRVKQNTLTHSKLLHFLDCLDVPAIATFRDSSVYTRLADEGSGIFDIEADASVTRELKQWRNVLNWIDQAKRGRTDDDITIRRSPRAASGHPRLARASVPT